MNHCREDQLFEQFRHTGDPGALGELFDRTAPELLRLAVHVCGDRHRGEDLVQSTFLAALEDLDAWDSSRPVLPWLIGILANRARDTRRREARRPDAGRLRAAATADPVASAEQREFRAAFEQGLEHLPSDARQVLILYLQHGLLAREIGELLGRPAGTVRAQISRAMEALRRALPAGFAAAAAATMTPGRGLAAVRANVLSAAAAGTAAAVLSGSTLVSEPTLGGLLMGKKTLLVALVVMAVGALYWFQAAAFRGGADAPELHAEAPPDAGDGPREPPAGGSRPASPPTPARAAVARPATGSLRVRLENGGQRIRVEDLGLSLIAATGSVTELRTGRDGVAEVGQLAPGRYSLLPQCSPARQLTVRAGLRTDVEIDLSTSLCVVGTVMSKRGPVAGARIYRARPDHPDGRQLVAVSGEDGHFAIPGLPSGTELWARASGHAPSLEQRPKGVAGSTVKACFFMFEPGYRLTGTVVGEDGAPVPHALVVLALSNGILEKGMKSKKAGLAGLLLDLVPTFRFTIIVRADATGRFVCDEVPAGPQLILARGAAAGSTASGHAMIDVRADADNQVDLHLGSGATIDGRVLDDHGRPESGVGVEAHWKGCSRLGALVNHLHRKFSTWRTKTAADGTFALAGLPEGNYEMSAGETSLGCQTELQVGTNERQTWQPTLAPGAVLRLRIEGPASRPAAGWSVVVRAPDGRSELARGQTDADGRCRIENLGPDDHDLALSPAGGVTLATRTGVRPGAREMVVRLRDGEWPSATLRGRLVDGDGVPVSGERVTCERVDTGDEQVFEGFTDDAGTFRIDALPAASYRLCASPVGYPETHLGPWPVAAGDNRDLGVLQLPLPGTILVEPPAVPDPDLQVRIAPAGGDPVTANRSRAGYRSHPLAPGLYTVVAFGPRTAAYSQQVEVREGRRSTVTVPNGPATPCLFTVRTSFSLAAAGTRPDAEDGAELLAFALPFRGDLRVYDRDGQLVLQSDLDGPAEHPDGTLATARYALRPGRYHAEVSLGISSSQAEAHFEIGTGSEPARIDLVFR